MARTLAADRGVPYFATFLDLLHKRVVVVGGGKVATTKVRALLPCRPAPLIVVAPRASAFIRRAAELGDLEWRQRDYAADDLARAALAFGATDDRGLNAPCCGGCAPAERARCWPSTMCRIATSSRRPWCVGVT